MSVCPSLCLLLLNDTTKISCKPLLFIPTPNFPVFLYILPQTAKLPSLNGCF